MFLAKKVEEEVMVLGESFIGSSKRLLDTI